MLSDLVKLFGNGGKVTQMTEFNLRFEAIIIHILYISMLLNKILDI